MPDRDRIIECTAIVLSTRPRAPDRTLEALLCELAAISLSGGLLLAGLAVWLVG